MQNFKRRLRTLESDHERRRELLMQYLPVLSDRIRARLTPDELVAYQAYLHELRATPDHALDAPAPIAQKLASDPDLVTLSRRLCRIAQMHREVPW
jgi:hypothetical protein